MRQQALEDPTRGTKGSTKEGYLFLQEKSEYLYNTFYCYKFLQQSDVDQE